MSRRGELARLAIQRVMMTRRAIGRVYFDMRYLPELTDELLSALAPALGEAEAEKPLDGEPAPESHGVRRSA